MKPVKLQSSNKFVGDALGAVRGALSFLAVCPRYEIIDIGPHSIKHLKTDDSNNTVVYQSMLVLSSEKGWVDAVLLVTIAKNPDDLSIQSEITTSDGTDVAFNKDGFNELIITDLDSLKS